MSWNRRALVPIGLLVVIGVVAVAFSCVALASGFPDRVIADRLAAVGTILGAGGFGLALVATGLAVLAYVNSLPRPDVYVISVEQVAQAFPPAGSWGLKVTLGNRGEVAARFVAVRVTFSDWRWQFGTAAPTPWTPDYSTNPFFERVTWEGGADAVLHPTWPYLLPELGQLVSSLSFGSGYVPSSIDFKIEIVANRMKPKSSDHHFKIA